MNTKKIMIFVLTFIMAISLFACGDENTNDSNAKSNTNESQEQSEENTIIEASDVDLEGLNVYEEDTFNIGDTDNKLDIYTSAMKEPDGNFGFDDRNEFAVIATINDSTFELMPKSYVQLGVPSVNVFEDGDGVLHVLIFDIGTSHYITTEYKYNEKENNFEGIVVLEYDNVNLLVHKD